MFRYEDMVYMNWAQEAEQKTAEGLNRPLVVRDAATGTLKVNFGRETLSILTETKHLRKNFPDRDVPKKARDLFVRFADLRNYNNSLEQMITLYNYLKTDMETEEFRLVSDEVAAIDKNLHAAEHSLTWNSGDLWDYIEELRRTVLDLNTRVKQAQENAVKIEDEINRWAELPLFKRVDEKGKPSLLDLGMREKNKEKRYQEIREAVQVIQGLVAENEKFYKIVKGGERLQKRWRSYLQFLDYLISDGLLITIACSVGYLLDQTDVRSDIEPLFQVHLELCDPNVISRPSLDKSIVNNFYDLMMGIVDDIFHMAALVPRIAHLEAGKPDNYLDIVNNHEELGGLRKMFMSRVELVIRQANANRVTYMEYSYLWTESIKEYMFYFLGWSRMLTEDEINMLEEDEKSVKKVPPVLAQFKERIDHYERIHDQADKIKPIKIFEKWFSADIRPFKQVIRLLQELHYLFSLGSAQHHQEVELGLQEV